MSDDLGYNWDLERGLLGILLTVPEMPHVRAEVAGILQPDDFSEDNRLLYSAILAHDSNPVDPLSLVAFLEANDPDSLKRIGGESRIYKLANDPPAFLLAEQYARELAELSKKRRRHRATERIAKAILSGQTADAQRVLEDLAEGDRDQTAPPLDLLSADQILTTDWPTPVWAIPDLLPVGLTILGGKSKVGKSWLCLQICAAVAAGGVALGQRVEKGPALYLALEDPPVRLQERMKKQNWPPGLPADFMPLGQFQNQIGDLRYGGGERLARQIDRAGYRLVVLDTLSRAVAGDQNDAQAMTAALSPIQEMAHAHNCAVLMPDHHHKLAGTDTVADILGSTAKGAIADTAWGLYRERGKAGAKLAIVGRSIAERELALTFDGLTGCWQAEGEADAPAMTDRRLELLHALQALRRCKCGELAQAIGQDRSNTYHRLQDLIGAGLVSRESDGLDVTYSLTDLSYELLH